MPNRCGKFASWSDRSCNSLGMEMTGSNPRPPACKPGALPVELHPRAQLSVRGTWIRTKDLSFIRAASSQLSYTPVARRQTKKPNRMGLALSATSCG